MRPFPSHDSFFGMAWADEDVGYLMRDDVAENSISAISLCRQFIYPVVEDIKFAGGLGFRTGLSETESLVPVAQLHGHVAWKDP